jgi:hypothetical protein
MRIQAILTVIYSYVVFNIILQSELSLPWLPKFDAAINEKNRVTIMFGAVSAQGIANPLQTGLYFQATKQLFWLSIPSVARFLITEGNKIIIDPVSSVDENSLRAFVLESCLGVLLLQRNVLLLHGGAIKRKNESIAFLSAPGTGLSTLMAALLKRGYSLLTDKICAIDTFGCALAGTGCVELRRHVADAIGFKPETLTQIRPGINKWRVLAGRQHCLAPTPIKAIYVLNFHPQQTAQFVKINDVQKIHYLQQSLYKLHHFPQLVQAKDYLQQCTSLSKQVEMISLTRQSVEYPLDQLVHVIEQDWIMREQ